MIYRKGPNGGGGSGGGCWNRSACADGRGGGTRTGRVLGLRAADDFDEFEVGELPVDLLSLGQCVAQDLLRDILDAVLSS